MGWGTSTGWCCSTTRPGKPAVAARSSGSSSYSGVEMAAARKRWRVSSKTLTAAMAPGRMAAAALAMRCMTSRASSEALIERLTATRSRRRPPRRTASAYERAFCRATAARAASETTSARFSSLDSSALRERTASTPSTSSPARIGTESMRWMPLSRAQSADSARAS